MVEVGQVKHDNKRREKQGFVVDASKLFDYVNRRCGMQESLITIVLLHLSFKFITICLSFKFITTWICLSQVLTS